MWRLLRGLLERLRRYLRPPMAIRTAAQPRAAVALGESWLLVFACLTAEELCRVSRLQAALWPLADQEEPKHVGRNGEVVRGYGSVR